jgi:hypothetical protein
VAGTVFGIVALVQLLRLLTSAEILVAGYRVPVWASGIAFVVAGGLSIWMWNASRNAGK